MQAPFKETIMETREFKAVLQKAANGDHDGVFVLNEESEDRMGDIIKVDGWKLKQFKKNPVALWQHDHDKPVGHWKNIRVEGKQLLGELKLAGTNLAKMARQLIEDGALRAVSVGFRPLEYEPKDPEDKYGINGFIIKEAELLETSLVSVPAHPNALLLSKKYGLSKEERQLVFAPSSRVEGNSAESRGIHPSVERAKQAIEAARQTLRK
jgi:HK97 family phage prohead protease